MEWETSRCNGPLWWRMRPHPHEHVTAIKTKKHICENMQNGHEIRLESREVILNVTRGVMRG